MPETRLITRVRERAAVRRYSPRTVDVYVRWIIRYVRFHGMQHPSTLGDSAVGAFLTYLASERKVAASTQNQALAALAFLYGEVLGQPLGAVQGFLVAKVPHRLPNVLSRDAVRRVLAEMRGTPHLMASMLYGTGLR